MKFVYQYRTSDNVQHSGTLVARDRETAFQTLKAQGIRPARLDEAPGLVNKILGKGKRWIAIVILLLALSITLCVLLSAKPESSAVDSDADAMTYSAPNQEERAQIFGDPYVMEKLSANGWRDTFDDPGDAWFARHAQPGQPCGCEGIDPIPLQDTPLVLSVDDTDELRKMKRIVNCMKLEYAEYLQAGGTVEQYKSGCEERQRVEKKIYDGIMVDFKALERRLDSGADHAEIQQEWDKKNATLRSLGLRTMSMQR